MQFSAYSPPVIEIGVGALMPETVMILENAVVFSATPVWSMKVNDSGVVSAKDADADNKRKRRVNTGRKYLFSMAYPLKRECMWKKRPADDLALAGS
jgi:hypothetical protein